MGGGGGGWVEGVEGLTRPVRNGIAGALCICAARIIAGLQYFVYNG